MHTNFYRHNKGTEKPKIITCDRITFNELTFVLKGELKYMVNNTTVTVRSNDCIYIENGSFRERTSSTTSDYVSFNFETNAPFDKLFHLTDCITTEIKMLFAVCDEIYDKYYNWSDKIDNVLKVILDLLQDKIHANEENPIILKIKRYIKKNYSEKTSLGAIASYIGYSPNYCDTLFKNNTGISIINFVINERIEEAKRLLAEGILSLKEIAETVGFEDYNYFSRVFKKNCGYTPTKYKLMIKNKI